MTSKVYDIAASLYGPYVQFVGKAGSWKNLTATGQVFAGPGMLLGFYVNNTSSGTLVLQDGLTATNPVGGTITPGIGWNNYPIVFKVGIFATIAGTGLDVTFSYLS